MIMLYVHKDILYFRCFKYYSVELALYYKSTMSETTIRSFKSSIRSFKSSMVENQFKTRINANKHDVLLLFKIGRLQALVPQNSQLAMKELGSKIE